MANQEDINRWEKGKSHWNKWATELLEVPKKWALKDSLQASLNGMVPNQHSIEWLEAASVDFSDYVFEDNTDFSNVIFPVNTILVEMVKQGKISEGLLNKTYSSFKNASLKAARFNEINLSGVNFEGATLEEANLNNTILIQTVFREANLKNATFKGAEISGCKFEKSNLERMSFTEAAKVDNCLFNGATMMEVSFAGKTIRGSFSGANLSSAIFDEAKISGGGFENAILRNASFKKATLEKIAFNGADCTEAVFTGAKLLLSKFVNTIATKAQFDQAMAERARFTNAKLENTTFQGAHLVEAAFGAANLTNSNISNTTLNRATFDQAKINNASMLGATFDKGTKFTQDPQVDGLSVDRYALECLDEYGGLSVGARMKLDIHDDVATLRSNYSGYKQWIHLLAFVGFTFPYVWFIVKQWGRASFLPENTEDSILLWQALGRFIYSGGDGWEQGWIFHWSFILFFIALLYNGLRFALLYKTKKLELAQELSGLPAAFSLNDRMFKNLNWRMIIIASKIGFYIYLAVVVFNLAHFFSMSVPIALANAPADTHVYSIYSHHINEMPAA